MIEGYNLAASLTDPDQIPNEEQFNSFIKTLRDLKQICESVRLQVSVTTLNRITDEFSKSVPVNRLAQQRMNEWFSFFTSELESRLFMLVLPHRVGYWHSQVWDGPPFFGEQIGTLLSTLEDGFRDAFYDATEAGNCFAYARFTACVYHLMRVAEYGLVGVARAAQVDEEKISKGWDHCIQGIEEAIKRISSTKPTIDWQDQVKRYSDVCAWFTTIKNGWRNPVSHIPRTYSEETASGMFSAVLTLFQHLRQQGYKQTPMPGDPISLPTDGP
jgi:hypothetical protein